jgi:lipopolysaccharide transport system ATP-binding protein
MSDVAVSVRGLSKSYKISHDDEKHITLAETLLSRLKNPLRQRKTETFWALKDVNFEIKKGEVVGIIGRNGAGKSTLLKVLSRITEPTTGEIDIHGRVGSLLEVGTGFHPELTGRENVYLNGAILGMSKSEIAKQFDAIVDFAGVEKFLDTPVKRYSSGMYVRLAFAVAAHLNPEILIVDEVLAVGDLDFQKKCLGKMGEVAKGGRTVLFVSHNMPAVRSLCTSALLLEHGQLKYRDDASVVVQRFVQEVSTMIQTAPLLHRTDRTGSGRVKLADFWIEDSDGNRIATAMSGSDLDLVFLLSCDDHHSVRAVDVGFSLHLQDGAMLCVLYSSYTGNFYYPTQSLGTFRCRIARLPLNAGRYGIGARIMINNEEADWPRDGIGFLQVEVGDFYGTGSRGFEATVPSLATPLLIDGQWMNAPEAATAAAISTGDRL